MTGGIRADVEPLSAAIDPTDQFYRRANEELARLTRERRPIPVLDTTLVGGQGLILRRIGTQAATLWVAQILAAAILVTPDPDDFLAAAALLRRFPDQRITLADGVVAVVSLRLRLPVWTYDHHFDTMRALVWRWDRPFRSALIPRRRAPGRSCYLRVLS